MGKGDEEPYASGNGEEDGGEEETVVITKPGDGRRGGESTRGTSNFIEYMLAEMGWSDVVSRYGHGITYDSGVHSPQLSDVPTDDITWTREASATAQGTRRWDLHDTADQLDHTVSDTAESPDGENLQHPVNQGYG